MQDILDFAKGACVDNIDKGTHPGLKPARQRDCLGIALPAFGGVFCSAVLGDIDRRTCEQSVAFRRQALRSGNIRKLRNQFAGQMGFAEIKAQSVD